MIWELINTFISLVRDVLHDTDDYIEVLLESHRLDSIRHIARPDIQYKCVLEI